LAKFKGVGIGVGIGVGVGQGVGIGIGRTGVDVAAFVKIGGIGGGEGEEREGSEEDVFGEHCYWIGRLMIGM
jgi:hypothetical protein